VASTSRSVSHQLSSDHPTAAYPLSSLLEAAESLAKTFIQLCRDGSAICSGCQRGSLDGILRHADGCAPGQTLVLAAAARRPVDPVWDEAFRGVDILRVGCDYCRAFAGNPFRDAFGAVFFAGHISRRDKARRAYRKAAKETRLRMPGCWISDAKKRTPAQQRGKDILDGIARDLHFGPERKIVCGAEFPGRRDGAPPATCDKPIGHAVDPDSNHWNKTDGFSWPTAEKIASKWHAERSGLAPSEATR
jgi:hypothetical protein